MSIDQITLRLVTSDNVRQICKLSVAENQRNYVASNGQSLAEAHFSNDAWHRAIYLGDDPVGFLMISGDPAVWTSEEKRESQASRNWRTILWRLMVDHRYQRRGIGRQAMQLLFDELRRRKIETFYTSFHGGDHSPQGFYESLGFELTGDVEDDEILASIKLSPTTNGVSDTPVLIDNPSEDEKREIDQRLEEFNKKTTGRDDFQPICYVLRDKQGKLVGGLRGVTGWEWMHVALLWVTEESRHHGYGSQLLQAAEAEAKRRGCRGACLSSFSFQAPEFYRKHGYTDFGSISEYPPGERLSFFMKEFQ